MDHILGYNPLKSAAALIAVISAFLWLRARVRRERTIRHIAGPPSPSWAFGNMSQLTLAEQYGDSEFHWQRTYGPVYRLKGCFGEDHLMVSDPGALNFIVNNKSFHHSPMFANFMKLLYDKRSIINVRGDYHRRLRTAFNPGFSAGGIRRYIPAINKAGEEITQALDLSLSLQSVDVCPLLSTASICVITQAAFGCTPEELGAEFVEIATRMAEMAGHEDKGSVLWAGLGNRLPGWVWDTMALLPTAGLAELRKGKILAKQIGREIVQGKLSAARQGLEPDDDIFSQILNASSGGVLSEEELAAHTSLLVIAGHETSANTMAFGLLELARNPEFQDSLRREINSSGEKTEAVYNSMPLLNAFIKEILRLFPIVPLEERIAIADTVIPLTDSINTSTGDRISEIPVRKGQIIKLGIAAYQRMESLWGADAGDFNPYRWIQGKNYQKDAVGGPYGNLLAFFGGPHVCLGWRLAVLEMQVIISELVGKFSFKLPEGDNVARMRGANVLQPTLPSGEKGVRLRVARII
ncbi:cytochrome P450 [Roridomyces roridus]|uniref:Cytochrome P450 n=1 Tax=Roridomyces roridus TaxID=1738132 RepID=A0AAD7C0E8_9AGAR|nr:cytochrome P450 [Roridomyces roridus]